jgi:hypothetical protein
VARIRTIKPEFPFSPEIGRISRDARLFFVESWMLCDRDGRFAWEPDRVKAQLFPYDQDAQLQAWLEEVVAQDLAVAYEVDGRRYVWVRTFIDHQRPHPKEPKGTIPPCPASALIRMVPWKETASRVSPGSMDFVPEPRKETASREKPGTIPSSPVGREGDLGEGDLGEPAVALSRFPIVKKRNLSAFWEGQVFDIPDAWARKLIAAANGTISEEDVRRFARETTSAMQATHEPVDTSVHLFAWLDGKWRDWQKGRATFELYGPNDRLWQETQARHAREDAEAAEMAWQPVKPFTWRPKTSSGESA